MKKTYNNLIEGKNFLRHPFLLIIRLYWGILLIQTGFGKWMSIDQISTYFSSLNIPLPKLVAYITATIELLGGISFVLGFLTPIFSILVIIVLLGAFATAHSQAFFQLFSNPSLFFTQAPFLFLYASLIILCFGPGFFSLDYWFFKRKNN